MKFLNWSQGKNKLLKRERDLSFEQIADAIERGGILSIEENSGYPGQNIYVLDIDDYALVVPFVETEHEIFLKTAFPSRKYT